MLTATLIGWVGSRDQIAFKGQTVALAQCGEFLDSKMTVGVVNLVKVENL